MDRKDQPKSNDTEKSTFTNHNSDYARFQEQEAKREFNRWAASIASGISANHPELDSLTTYDHVREFVEICNRVSSQKGTKFDYKEIVTTDSKPLLDFCTMSDEEREKLKEDYGISCNQQTSKISR